MFAVFFWWLCFCCLFLCFLCFFCWGGGIPWILVDPTHWVFTNIAGWNITMFNRNCIFKRLHLSIKLLLMVQKSGEKTVKVGIVHPIIFVTVVYTSQLVMNPDLWTINCNFPGSPPKQRMVFRITHLKECPTNGPQPFGGLCGRCYCSSSIPQVFFQTFSFGKTAARGISTIPPPRSWEAKRSLALRAGAHDTVDGSEIPNNQLGI